MTFKDRTLKKNLNTENVDAELRNRGYNQFDLAANYIQGFKGIGKPIKSDLRSNDKNYSLHTQVGKYGDLIVSDFGLKIGMTIFDYIGYKYYGEGPRNYIKGLNKIKKDYRLENLSSPMFKDNELVSKEIPKKHNIVMNVNSLSVKLEVRRQRVKGEIHWSEQDIQYWKQFGISISKLEEKKIVPLSIFWITNYSKGGIRIKYDVSKELAYVYPFFRDEYGHFMYKIYLPNGYKGDTNFKWFSNVNKKVVQNIENIPKKGDLLIIQSSYKDICTMEVLLGNLPIVAPNGEGMWFDTEIWKYLRTNWKNIILFGNNDSEKEDNPGLNFARKHGLEYNIPFIALPDNTTSDISDYYKKYGKDKAKKILDTMMNNVTTLLV